MLQPVNLVRGALALAAAALLAGCGTVDTASRSFAGVFSPYRVEVVQGNFVSSEQVELLKSGMSRIQVRELLGTPLVASVFHADRWDYVFTIDRQGLPRQQRRLTVFFKNDALDRWEGDPMPSETEFVTSIQPRKRSGTVPVLEASDADLERLASKPAAPPARAPEPPPAAASYPPLEPPVR